MRNFQDSFETCKRSFIIAFSNYMTVPLKVGSCLTIVAEISMSEVAGILDPLLNLMVKCSHKEMTWKGVHGVVNKTFLAPIILKSRYLHFGPLSYKKN